MDSLPIPEWSVQKQHSVQGSRLPLAAEKFRSKPLLFWSTTSDKDVRDSWRWEVEVSLLYFYINGSPKVTVVESLGGQ